MVTRMGRQNKVGGTVMNEENLNINGLTLAE